jgi:shikimate dehydrogenase
MKINGATRLICLIGHPVEHSFSPVIHNYLFEKYNLNLKYLCFDITKECLEDSIKGMKSFNILGANVTIPYKVDIMKYLDYIDKNAKLIGAVNTIKNENGKLKGYNTDGSGFVKSILDSGYDIKNKNVMILGAGGGCRSIAIEIASNGANSITIRNRSVDKAKNICDMLNDNFNIKTYYYDINIKTEDLNDIDILINTTSLGMAPNVNTIPIDENIKTNKKMLVCDIVYNPNETKFIKWAKNNNLDVVYGINMLINQGLNSFNIWTGIEVLEREEIKSLFER